MEMYQDIIASSGYHALLFRDTLEWRHNGHDGVSNYRRPDFFAQLFFQTQIKENSKAPRYLPVVRGIHWSPVDSPHKGPVT